MNTIDYVYLILCLQICFWWSDNVDLCSGKCDRTQICVNHPRERRNVCILKRCMKLRSHGFCRKFTFRYYFDPFTFKCNRFKYGGCYGSRNNFLSKESCDSRCTPPPVETKVFSAITLASTTTVTRSSTATIATQASSAITPTIVTNITPTVTISPTIIGTPPSTATATPITTLATTAATTITTPTNTTTILTIASTGTDTTVIPTSTTTSPTTTTTAVSCGSPPSIPGLQLLSFANVTNETLPGDIRYYKCQNENLTFDYIFTANSECSSIRCQSDGHWTHFNGTCTEPFAGLPTNTNGSIAGLSGRITSPNWPSTYVPPNHGVYRYSIITPRHSITFTFNGNFGIDSHSALVIFCGFDVPIDQQNMMYINRSTNPGPFTCLTGCATVAFQVSEFGTGSRQGFDITWQANN